jgi:spermidine synthase
MGPHAEPSVQPAAHRRVILAIFVLSGAAGLIYEVVWARQLVLVFGNTTQAVSAILTGFFAGMAIGGIVGGRVADRVRSPLRLYGFLEIVVAAIALSTPVLFQGVQEAYRSSYDSLTGSPGALLGVRYGLALVALAPATVLLGATLPVLTRQLARSRTELGSAFGRLYTFNTIGAIAGTVAAGLILIELVGLAGTLAAGAACSFVAGASALLLSARSPRFGPTAAAGLVAGSGHLGQSGPTGSPGAEPAAWQHRPVGVGAETAAIDDAPLGQARLALALVVAFVSGFATLGLQMAWTRVLSIGSGGATYVFTSILLTFLVGIAVGAEVFSIRFARTSRPLRVLGIAQIAAALLLVAGAAAFSGPLVLSGMGAGLIVWLLPTVLVLGLVFPLCSLLVGDTDRTVGSRTGLLVGTNTLGAILGASIVPFVLQPSIGTARTIVLIAAIVACCGAMVLVVAGLRAHRRGTGALAMAGTAAAVLICALAVVPTAVARDRAVAYVEAMGGEVLASAEDEVATVVAGQVGSTRHLWVQGTSMTALTVDAWLMAYLPLMYRPEGRTALVIAFGMGSTYRSALTAGLSVEGVELVPSVPSMFHWYHDDADRVISDSGGHLVIADGRNHVELEPGRFDIVIADPPPPIRSSGTAVLYSREFYDAASSRLEPGGVMMEWMPYDQTVDEFRSHVATFASVFPHVDIAFGPGGNGVFMLGSAAPLDLTDAAIRSVLARPGVIADLSEPSDAPARDLDAWARLIPALSWIDGDRVTDFAGDAPLITDDRPRPEYWLLRSLFGSESRPMREDTLRTAMP